MTASQQIPPPSPDGDRRPRLPLAPGALRSWTSGAGLAFVCAASPATSAVPTGLDRAPHAAHASIAAPAPASIIDSLEPTSTRVRRLVDASGLTIQQFGHVFSVSRRSVYNWLRGEALAPENVERLHRFERILRLIGRDAPRLVRAVLLTPHPAGGRVLDWLAEGRFDEAEAVLSGPPPSGPLPPRPPGLLPPDVLMSGLADRPIVPGERRRVKATRRTPSNGSTTRRDD